jgi:hypothetical protein
VRRFKKPKKISSRKSKVLERIENLAFPKRLSFYNRHTIRSQFWNCFSIRNGSFSDELHEFRKVLNPEMTDAYFYQKHLCARLGSGTCRSVKGQVVVWETKPILKEALIYTESNFQIQFTKISRITKIHLISRQRGKQVSSTVGHDLMHDHPYAERRFAQAHDNLDQLIAILKAEI